MSMPRRLAALEDRASAGDFPQIIAQAVGGDRSARAQLARAYARGAGSPGLRALAQTVLATEDLDIPAFNAAVEQLDRRETKEMIAHLEHKE